jgi:hypothetical protein
LPDAEIPEIHPTIRNAKIRLFYGFKKYYFCDGGNMLITNNLQIFKNQHAGIGRR